MNDYGVCLNSKCRVSSLRPELDELYKAFDETDRLLRLHESVEALLPELKAFSRYFQNTALCGRCGRPIERDYQPVKDITNLEEKARIELLNEALHASQKLHALGIF